MKKTRYIFLNGIGLGLFLGSLFDLIYNPSFQLSSLIFLFIGIVLWIISILDYRRNQRNKY